MILSRIRKSILTYNKISGEIEHCHQVYHSIAERMSTIVPRQISDRKCSIKFSCSLKTSISNRHTLLLVCKTYLLSRFVVPETNEE